MSAPAQPVPVILVHGLWMTGHELFLLARRLRACGFAPQRFRYPTVRRGPAENARALYEHIRALGAPRVHVVGHSLGGVVILRMLHDHPDVPVGRAVLLGSPVRGSAVARRLARWRWTRAWLGRSYPEGLDGTGPQTAPEQRELLIVAGTLGWEPPALIGALEPPHDGTVAVAETEIPGVPLRTVRTTHLGLVFSRRVARLVCEFLERGAA